MIFLLIGLTVAVATVVILTHISMAMNADISRKLDEYGANILITPHSDDLSLSYGGMSVGNISFDVAELHQEDLAKIRTIKNSKNISIIAPKLLNVAQVNNQRVMVIGVDFPAETALKKWWKIQGERPSQAQEALIGWEAHQKLNLDQGDAFLLKDKTYRVAGVLAPTGSQDDGTIFIQLSEAQALFQKAGLISLAEIAALCYDCPIEEIIAQTSEKLPGAKVAAVRQTIESRMEAMRRFEHFSLGISLVIMFVGGLIVFITITASVNERKGEIGVFRSIGFRRGHIMQIILLEGLWLSSLAGFLGYLGGFFAARNVATLLEVTTNVVAPNASMFFMALGLSVFIGLGASLYPSLQAARLDPTTALRAL